jgi:N-ethylmaleimide reductase
MELLKPQKLGSLLMPNKIVMAPMTRSRADNAGYTPTDMHVEYYKQRASAGLIISEGTVVSEQGRGYIHTPGIYSQNQVEQWQKVTAGVHDSNGRIFIQLWHTGRISHPDFHKGKLPVAPSAINPNSDVFTINGLTKTVTPRALTVSDIQQVVASFKKSAENAMEAGFDGVEVHSSNGYLFHQFFSSSSNLRTDEYGGTKENKARIFFETLDAIRTVIPENKIGVRLNPMMHDWSGISVDEHTAETFDYIVSALNDYNIAYLHLTRAGDVPNKDYFIKDVIGHYRKIYKGFLIANGGYDAQTGEQELLTKRADAIAFGRPFIANPDFPERISNDWPLAEADTDYFYTPGEKGYTDYPEYKG